LTPEFPLWLRQQLPNAEELSYIEKTLGKLKLHTICQSGRCPNLRQCFPHGVAFLILGNVCTRNCYFCAVDKGLTLPPDPYEPAHIVEAAIQLNLNYIFITSVTRDDLPDGGASHYAYTIRLIHKELPSARIEVLIPDFKGDAAALNTIIEAGPTVIGHNLETVPRLYPVARPMADYQRSIGILKTAKELDADVITKSGLMLGLGETRDEVIAVMQNLRDIACDLLTLGQYLQPAPGNYPVARFVTPEEFAEYETIGYAMGFKGISSSPLVRSSFRADELFAKAFGKTNTA
jgi:lipoyl synthase